MPTQRLAHATSSRWLYLLPAALFVAIGLWIARTPAPDVPAPGVRQAGDEQVPTRDAVRLDPDRPMHAPDVAFGLTLNERQAIYATMARNTRRWWRHVEGRFPGDEWSQHDDFANNHARYVRARAEEWGLNPSQLYLVYDEGIRQGWTVGRTADRFPATWAPLRPRTR